MQYTEVHASEIVDALLKHPTLNFLDKGEYLRKGECPDCRKRELFLRKSEPYRVMCSREQKCGYSESTRELVPELFTNYVERFPQTNENPNATADAYLSHNRGFALVKLRGCYQQAVERIEVSDGVYEQVPSIRFYLDAERTRYWARLIDKTKKDGQKAHFAGKRKPDGTLFRGDYWMPPKMEIQEGDTVFIVEGIFHAIAFWLAGFKAIAAFSCNNFPAAAIEEYKGKRISWMLALDDGEAGRKYALKFYEELEERKERSAIYLTGDERIDWDDLYRTNDLNAKFLADCRYRGDLFKAPNIKVMAYHWHLKTKLRYGVLEHRDRLYLVQVPNDLEQKLDGAPLEHGDGKDVFVQVLKTELISNCIPQFLYTERDEILDEQRYVFRIRYSNGSASGIVGLDGGNIESPTAFNKALLTRTLGGTFDGGIKELKYLRDNWLNRQMKLVRCNPFLGYDIDSQTYVFQDFAFHKGKELQLNDQGFFQVNSRTALKTSFRGFVIERGEAFRPDWLNDFIKVFHWHGLVTLAWWTGSYFAEQIRRRQKSWPFFELTGEQGAGKSTILEFCWKLSGRDGYEGFDALKASPAGRRRVFNQAANLPVALIESDRDDGAKDMKKGGFNFDELKPLYNGRSTGTLGVAKRGHDTEEPLFKGSLMIAQNATVDGSPALLSRIVHCHVTLEHHNPGLLPLARKFEQLTAADMAGYMRTVLSRESDYLALYEAEFAKVEQEWIGSTAIKELRIIKCHAQVYAAAVALQLFFPQIDAAMLEKLKAFLFGRALDRQRRMVQDHPLVEQFWDTYLYLNEQPGKQNGDPFDNGFDQVLNHSNSDGRIAINLNQFAEICRKYGQEPPDIKQLKKLLPGSTRYPFIETGKVKSRLLGKALHCWIFKEKS